MFTFCIYHEAELYIKHNQCRNFPISAQAVIARHLDIMLCAVRRLADDKKVSLSGGRLYNSRGLVWHLRTIANIWV